MRYGATAMTEYVSADCATYAIIAWITFSYASQLERPTPVALNLPNQWACMTARRIIFDRAEAVRLRGV